MNGSFQGGVGTQMPPNNNMMPQMGGPFVSGTGMDPMGSIPMGGMGMVPGAMMNMDATISPGALNSMTPGMQPMGGMADGGMGGMGSMMPGMQSMGGMADRGMGGMGSMTPGMQSMGGMADGGMGGLGMPPGSMGGLAGPMMDGNAAPRLPDFGTHVGMPSGSETPINRGRPVSPAHAVPSVSVGRFIPSAQEEHIYRHLFRKALSGDNADYVAGKQAKHMFFSTGLPRKVLHEIWAFSDLMQEGRLDYPSFCVACRMLSHVQAGLPFNPELLHVEPQQMIRLPGFLDDYRERSTSAPRRVASRSASRSPRRTWTLSQKDKDKYLALFIATDSDRDGFVEGDQAKLLLQRSKLTKQQLSAVWDLADMDSDGRLRFEEFLIAMHCVTMIQKGHAVPRSVPPELIDSVRIVDDLQFGSMQEMTDGNMVEPVKEAVQSEFARKALGFASGSPQQRPSLSADPYREDIILKPNVDATDLPMPTHLKFPDVLKGVESRTKLFKPLQKLMQKEFDITGASALEKAWETDSKVLGDGNPSALTGLEMEMVDQRRGMEKHFARRKDFDAQAQELKTQIDDLLEQRARQDVERQKLVTACENYQDQISFLREQIDDVSHDVHVMQESNVVASRGAQNPIPSANPGATREEQREELLAHIRAERDILRGDQRTIDELRVELTRHVKDKLQKQTRQTVLLEKHRQAEQDRVMLVTAYDGERYKLLTIRSERVKLLEERAELTAQKAEFETRRETKLQQRELAYREENHTRNRGEAFNAPMAFPASPRGHWTEFGHGNAPKTAMPEWESFSGQ
eukprot:GEMP01002580.1.p1 GENE.GEMP01002580.1~~GEMP01002580.1.p1  ORF type:complete len:801 (+),score=160.64 GEMP01002580.1:295-2697(+)